MRIGNVCAALIALALATTGCENTVKGAQEDTRENSLKASQATDDAVKRASEASKDISAAATLTPAVKTAITSEPTLNDPVNLIDVDTTAEKVTLSGHVKSGQLKTLAGEIATRVLTEHKATQTLENNLEVKP